MLHSMPITVPPSADKSMPCLPGRAGPICLKPLGLFAWQQPWVVSTDASHHLAPILCVRLQELENGGEPFPPFQFLLTLRQAYPQFAQQVSAVCTAG